ncbi:MAG TPA: thiamine phosphate synthase [Leucothrix mucor]|uniref:Thiamine-phosphate synthase n=1 Tax=Leucothrix mucor TaxID=45248 RepID=A0A7V2T1C4_LEUMU|nr:thiamine phosphate synthase [Leucothrix mucor]
MKGLYAITESDSNNLLKNVRLALQGGVSILQYRNKNADIAQKITEATALLSLCQEYNVCFIINDDIQLAKQVRADGVHLGRDDGSISEARDVLGDNAIIGVTCYQDIERAVEAEKSGANYVAFGSFFASPTKPNAPRADIKLLQQARVQLSLPICCIGGITLQNADRLIEHGADMVAVISSLFAAEDIKQTARQFSAGFV